MIKTEDIICLLKDKNGRVRSKFTDLYKILRRFTYSDNDLEIIKKNVEEALRFEEEKKALRSKKTKVIQLVK